MKLALFDIDGVLADDRAREHFAVDRKYADYFDKARMAADLVWEQGRDLIAEKQADGWVISYLTGRREDRREVTEDWLDLHGFPQGRLTMRAFSQTMPLANFKEQVLRKILLTGTFEDVVLFDDDPEVIRLVQAEIGVGNAVHCTWHIKKKAMVKLAQA